MIGLDTNVLVRYIAQDDAAQSAVATRVIEKSCTTEAPGYISLLVLTELVWVCEACYQATRAEVSAIIRKVLGTKQLQVQNAALAWQALSLFENSKADYSDCLIEQLSTNAGCSKTLTFDKQAAKIGMSLIEGKA